MRHLTLALFLLLFTISADAQVFAGKVSIGFGDFTADATTAGLDTYTGTVSNFTSPYSYLVTGISVGHILVTPGITNNECRKYVVTAVNTSGLNYTVQELANYNSAPFGGTCQISGTVKGLIPILPVTGVYISEEVSACVTFYNNQVLDTLTSDVERAAGAPAGTPETWDDLYINETNGDLYYNDGSAWVLISSGAVTADVVNLNPAFDQDGDATNETTVQESLETLRIYGFFKNDADAALNGVGIGQLYFAHEENTLGLKAGTLVSRRN